MTYDKNKKEKETKMTGEKQKKFLKNAQDRLKLAIDADRHNREQAVEDLKFLNGEQWDEGEKQKRKNKNRPALMINLLPKYRNQLVGEQRQNRPRIKIRPVDSKADLKIAKIREGLISNINYLSNFDNILDQAYGMVVDCGYGAWRILTRYTEENPFIQEIYKEPIPNPFLVYFDPSAKNPDKSDAMWCFVLCKYGKDEFEDEYPDADIPGGEQLQRGVGTTNEHWYDKEHVTVAEYYLKTPVKKTIALLSDGTCFEESEAREKIKEIMEPLKDKAPDAIPLLKIEKTKEVTEYEIKQYVITYSEVLEEHEWAGKFIPIVTVYGIQRNIEGKPYIQGLIRNAKDSQRLYNYWYTSAAERIALAPKTPWVGSAKMFEGYEKDWAVANVENIPFLKARPDPNFKGMLPRREPPIQADTGLLASIAEAKQNVKDTVGMLNDLGEPGAERSGTAIMARQKPGDIGTFEFFDNLVKAIKYDGMVTNDLIPYIYDTERDVRLRNEEGTENFVPVNTTADKAYGSITKDPLKYQGLDAGALKGMMQQQGANAKYNDLTVGKYDVIVDTGPSYATQRVESVDAMLKLINSDPDISKIGRDILVGNMDFMGSDDLAARLKKTVPPGMIELKAGEEPPKPLPPPPQVVLLQSKVQSEQMRQKVAMVQYQVKLLQLYKESKETDTNLRQEIIKVLAELHSPDHPADEKIRQQVKSSMMGGQQGEMPQPAMQ